MTRGRALPPFPLGLDQLRAALQAKGQTYPGTRLSTRDLVGGRFVPRPNVPPPELEPRVAGVVTLLYPYRRELHLPLIRRPDYPGHHAGQVGLPGGSFEPGDEGPLQTALREAEEEIGVPDSCMEVLAALDPVYIPVSNFRVFPFVAWMERRPRFRPDPFEVAELIELPLSVLLNPASLAEEEWMIRGERKLVPYIRFGDHKVWGATAMILDQVLWKLQPAGAGERAPQPAS